MSTAGGWAGQVSHETGAWRWMVPLLFLVVGIWLMPLAYTCQLDCVPGDLGDARFNSVVLEHFHRWVIGREPSLLSPSFFYPLPGAIAFSDNHWGTAWIYSVYRAMGWDRYQAFDLWFVTGFTANFVVSHVVFRRLRFSSLASAVAAFAFTFAMPVIAKYQHAQLTYRFLVPVGLLLWQYCIFDGRWRWFAALALVVVSQFYMSIYVGYFLVLLLGAWACADCLLHRLWPSQRIARWKYERLPSSRWEGQASLVLTAASAVALVLLMYPYFHYSRLYGFGRGLGEIASMTPRPQSYLLADHSRIWGHLSGMIGPNVPMRHEHQMFFGVGLLALSAMGLFHHHARMRWTAAVSLGLLVLLTLTFGKYSLYLAIGALPGVGSVRAMARIGTVLVVPLALLAAMAVDAFPREKFRARLLVALLVLIMGAESTTYRVSSFDAAEGQQRIETLRRQYPDALTGDPVIFSPAITETPYYVSELDGMILAQDLGLPTLNGYSGNFPPGYMADPERPPCVQALMRIRAAQRFQVRHVDQLALPVPDLVLVAGHGACASRR